MKAHGNGKPETCASNLLRIVRGEVPYDRVRGRDGALIDQPNATDEAVADAEWVLETFEPRVTVNDIQIGPESGNPGNFYTSVDIERKEDEDA
ncbi:MAG: early E1A protein [Butyricicoccus sp.]|nr:early E1A protein [Butyricicoccus sp.]